MVLITAFIILVSGCSSNKYVQLPYSLENAYKNTDVIDILNGNKTYNTDKLEEFMNSVKNGEKKKVRIVSYHKGNKEKFEKSDWNYPEQIYDLSFNGKNINVISYSTASASSENKLMETFSKIYKTINMVVSKYDTQYVLNGSNGNRIIVLSIAKNGYIDEDAQKYIHKVLNEQ